MDIDGVGEAEVLVDIKAGTLELINGLMTANNRKGLLRVYKVCCW